MPEGSFSANGIRMKYKVTLVFMKGSGNVDIYINGLSGAFGVQAYKRCGYARYK